VPVSQQSTRATSGGRPLSLAGCSAPARCLSGGAGPALGTAAAAWWRPAALSAPAASLLGGCRGYAKYPPHTELQMPSLSPTMNQARQLRQLVRRNVLPPT